MSGVNWTLVNSSPSAASDLLADPSADVRSFVQKVRDFFPDASALTGKTAFGVRSIGNLAIQMMGKRSPSWK